MRKGILTQIPIATNIFMLKYRILNGNPWVNIAAGEIVEEF